MILPSAYRPEVDGLRTVAVLLVVFFHAFPSMLPGGFIGVDIFFVISGFLITGILRRELGSGSFSIVRFYARRLRRIAPALLLVLTAVLLAASYLLESSERHEIYGQAIASALFSANILFWMQSGYFDPAALTKPLLHIWSLGVEEQYYLIWPLLLWLAWSRKINLTLLATLVALASMVCNVMLIEHHGSAAFFLPMSRLWELSIGSIIALTGARATTRLQAEISTVAGFALIAAGVALLTETSLFPGWWALLPTVGAAFIIFAGPMSAINKYVLMSPPFVWIGLISYPLYLWHWPVLSFLSTLAGGIPVASVRAGAVLASLVLAALTFGLLELPLRRIKSPLLPPALVVALLCVALVGTASLLRDHPMPLENDPAIAQKADLSSAVMGSGFEWRDYGCGGTPSQEADIRDCLRDRREPARFAIWGDSHANALMPGLLRESTPGSRWMQVGAGGCPPLAGGVLRTFPGTASYDAPVICKRANAAILDVLKANPSIKAVVFLTAARIVTPLMYSKSSDEPYYDNAVVEGMSAAARELDDAGKTVYFVVDNPVFAHPKDCIERAISIARENILACAKSLQQHLDDSKRYFEIVAAVKTASPFIRIIDPTRVLCSQDNCGVSLNGKFLYTDGDHLSDTGNGLVARYLIDKME
ncbi:acyltransferase family protein [Rhizobium sp. HT1-10]|uniref:acyltransferase family protein n=1 Tax=Rhizobium sp. HT1-10 TaxID=3111638 RepID=UPI003C1BBC4D